MAVKLPSALDLGARPTPTPSGGVASYTVQSPEAAAAPGLALSNLGSIITKVTNEQQDKLNTAKAEDAYNQLREAQLDLTIGENGFSNKKGGDALDGALIPTYNSKFDEAAKRIAATLQTPDQRAMFEKRAAASKMQFQTDLGNHVQRQDYAYQGVVFKNTWSTEVRNAGANPQNEVAANTALVRLDASIDAEGRRTGAPKEWYVEARAQARDAVWTSRFDTWRTMDPVGALAEFQKIPEGQISPAARQRLGDSLFRDAKMLMATDPNVQKAAMAPPTQTAGAPANGPATSGTFDTAVKSLLRREGGYVASDGKSGAPANFGINQRANPDIDVKNLTQEKAVEIYRERYWSKIDGDKLAPATAMVALDTAALQGVEVAKKLLAETGGDPAAMIARRREMLTSLAKDPEHAKNLPGWMSRLDGLEAQVKDMPRTSGIQRQDPTAAFATQLGLRDPSIPTGNAVVDALPPDQKLQVMTAARTLAAQNAATANQAMTERVQDTRTAYLQGLDVPNPPSQGELAAVHGPERGARIYEELQADRRFGQIAQSFGNMSPLERAQTIAANTPVPGSPGYTTAVQRFEELKRADAQVMAQIRQDPVGYTIRNSPLANAAYSELTKAMSGQDAEATKTAAKRYAIATIGEQQRLGVANPEILPKQLESAIVAGFYNQKEGGQNAAQLVQGLASTWGEHWPAVYGQVADKLPNGAYVIAAGMDARPAEMLARVTAIKREDLVKGLNKDDVKAVSDTLPGVMADFRRTMDAQGDEAMFSTPGRPGKGKFAIFYDETEKLALAYLSSGMTPSKAATQAFQDVVGARYEFVQNYRVPKTQNVVAVNAGAKAALNGLENLVDTSIMQLPVSLAGLKDADRDRAFFSALKEQGYWVTNQYETGLDLWVNGAAVVTKDRQPISLSWFELETIGTESPVRGKATGFGETGGGAATGVQRAPRSSGGGGEGGGGGGPGDKPENLVRPDRSPQRAADYDATVGGAPQKASAPPPPSRGQTGLSNRPLNAQEAENDPRVQALLRKQAEDAQKKKR